MHSQNETREHLLHQLAPRFDLLAQLVEHNTFNVGVLGSNPKQVTYDSKRVTYDSKQVTYVPNEVTLWLLRNHEKKRLEESITQVVLSLMFLIIKHLQPMYA